MNNKNLKLLYSDSQIASRVKQLGEEISAQYKGTDSLLCVCVLKGAAVFFADLVRSLTLENITLDFITLSSYGQGRSSKGEVAMLDNLAENPEGRHVLLVEDIVDSGLTLNFLNAFMKSKNPLSLRAAALLDKPSARKIEVNADFTAFTLSGDEFVVGYGLDLNQRHRNLSGIYQIN